MITIYSKEQCKYCVLAKQFMKDNEVPFEEVKLDPETPEYAQQRQELIDKSNHKTFPWVYVKEDFVGGYNDLVHAYNTQKLHQMFEQAGMTLELPDF